MIKWVITIIVLIMWFAAGYLVSKEFTPTRTDGALKIFLDHPEFDQYTIVLDDDFEALHDKEYVILRVEKSHSGGYINDQ